ncbi:TraR/DksA family transcriptional regulator [Botrimarina hoheduenensis]|uniref:General stress protein 16O n=1 Tax=Botrimarina hoheduenensis TaxID=2528000 RepID=A0A5C5VYI0_9BACT|nr:TraR/DksA family transcriptional regulator [Botrimarina hoheduenensis]TWT42562.1 General stress protein 16O [Botrimarina hoheduenensis]
MKKADLEAYRQRLMLLRARLCGDVSALAKSALHGAAEQGGAASSMPIHMAELGSEAFEQEFNLSVMETEEDAISSIDAALRRIEEETFGTCTGCEGTIPKMRLNAIPYAPMCVRCAEQEEAH